jgi:hypothetical protein
MPAVTQRVRAILLRLALAAPIVLAGVAVPVSTAAAGICTSGVFTSVVNDTTSIDNHDVYSLIEWRKTYYCSDPTYSPIKVAVVRIFTRATIHSSASRYHFLAYAAVHQSGNPLTLEATYPVYFNQTAPSGAQDCIGPCTISRTWYPRTSSGGLFWMSYSRNNFVRVYCRCAPSDRFDDEHIWHFFTRSSSKISYVWTGQDIGCSSGWCP